MPLFLWPSSRRIFRVLLSALLTFTSWVAVAQANLGVIADYSQRWQVYEPSEGVYVPYIPAYHKKAQRLHLMVGSEGLEAYYLQVQAPQASHLFLNNQLLEVFPDDGRMVLSMERLRNMGKRDTMLLTIYSHHSTLSEPKAYLVKYTAKPSDWLQESAAFPLLSIGNLHSRHGNLTLIGLGVLGLLVAAVQLSVPIFQWDYLRRYLSLFTKTKGDGGRISAQGFFMFAVFYGCALGYSLLLFISPVQLDGFGLPDGALARFIYLSAWMMAFLGVRILAISISVSLYSFRRGLNIHLQEVIDINQIYILALFVTAVILHLSNLLLYDSWRVLAQVALVLSLLASSGFVAYRINKSFPFRKVYLFSYLCATEFFPVLILIKLLIGE